MFRGHIELDEKLIKVHMVGVSEKELPLPPTSPMGFTNVRLSVDESLFLSHLMDKETQSYYFDTETRTITNEKGEVMFQPNNGTSSSTMNNENLKVFIDKVEDEKATEYTETLAKVSEIHKKIKELDAKFNQEKGKLVDQVLEAVSVHQNVVSNLHDKLGKILALSGYNEFKHKIHVETDGSVFMIPKDVKVGDLD